MNALTLSLVAVVSSAATAGAAYDPISATCHDDTGALAWNAATVGPCADFHGQVLTGRSFAGANLRGARFDGATLEDVSFAGARLEGATFAGADLTNAVLTGAELVGVDFTHARLVRAHLERTAPRGSFFTRADLRQAHLDGTDFAGADLRRARFSRVRPLLAGARWAGAVVAPATLPFTRAELAAKKVVVEEELEFEEPATAR